MSTLSLNRRRLLRLGAVVTGITSLDALGSTGRIANAAAGQSGSIEQGFLSKKADVRQIWDFVTVDQAQMGITAMRNAMAAFESSYHKSHYLIVNLRGSAVIFGLNAAMWQKYNIGKQFKVFNLGYDAKSNLNPLHPGLRALQQRGAHVAVCHDALRGVGAQFMDTRRGSASLGSIYQELAANLLPDAQETPSGAALIAIAQQIGFTYAKE